MNSEIEQAHWRELVITSQAKQYRSSGRLRQWLQRKHQLSWQEAEAVIASLVVDGYVDDLAYARSIAIQHRGRQAESHQKFAQRLAGLGVDRQLIPRAIEERKRQDGSDLQLLQGFLRSFAESLRHLRDSQSAEGSEAWLQEQKELDRIHQALLRRGFRESDWRKLCSRWGLDLARWYR